MEKRSKMVITSLDNEKVKYYYKLQKKKYRDLHNEFIVEGEHLVLEAYKTGMLKEVLLEEGSCVFWPLFWSSAAPLPLSEAAFSRDASA